MKRDYFKSNPLQRLVPTILYLRSGLDHYFLNCTTKEIVWQFKSTFDNSEEDGENAKNENSYYEDYGTEDNQNRYDDETAYYYDLK